MLTHGKITSNPANPSPEGRGCGAFIEGQRAG
jgi:hypothetical protein